MRVVLRAMARDRRHLDEAPVVLFVERPQNAPLHRLEAICEVGDRAIADDVGGVFKEARVHAAVERHFDFAGRERTIRDGCSDLFSEDMAVTVGLRGGFLRTARGLRL